ISHVIRHRHTPFSPGMMVTIQCTPVLDPSQGFADVPASHARARDRPEQPSARLNAAMHQTCTPMMRCWWHSSWRIKALPVTLIRPTTLWHLADPLCQTLRRTTRTLVPGGHGLPGVCLAAARVEPGW